MRQTRQDSQSECLRVHINTSATIATTIRRKKIMKICYRLKFTTANNSHAHTPTEHRRTDRPRDRQTGTYRQLVLPPFVILSVSLASASTRLCWRCWRVHAVHLVNATNSREHLRGIIINLSEVHCAPQFTFYALRHILGLPFIVFFLCLLAFPAKANSFVAYKSTRGILIYRPFHRWMSFCVSFHHKIVIHRVVYIECKLVHTLLNTNIDS